MESVSIKDMAKGMTVTGYYLVKNMAIKTAANNKVYGDYTLADGTGEVNAKLWEVADPAACPDVGTFLKVQGMITEWQGKLQLRMDRLREVTDEDGVDLSELVPAAPEAPQDMMGEIEGYLKRIENPHIRAIVSAMLHQRSDQLAYYPAALKNHHSIRSGLLYHTLTMLRAADGMLAVYDFLDADLLRAGVIIHDLSKTEELKAGNAGVASEYTTQGLLLGHITQGIVEIARIGEQLKADPEVIEVLQHMVLAHHYEPEYGSPRRPMFPEAEMLHYLDMIDARMFDMRKALDDTQTGDFSAPVWTLNNRRLYKRNF